MLDASSLQVLAFFPPESPWGWLLLGVAVFLLYRRFSVRSMGRTVGNYRAAVKPDAPPAILSVRDEALENNLKALDLSTGATFDQVKAAYRELVKIWHPDRFAHDAKLQARANAKLVDINAAYERLRIHFEG